MDTLGTKRTFVVAFDHSQGDKAVLLVGEGKKNHIMTVLSAFEGKEAIDIYKKLISGGVMK